jgi:NAD(P)-dependent dehydrogenase (short-subunit alcohol dehydrogenase family)
MLKLPITFFKNKFSLPPLPPPGSLNGQHVLITGGNCGLGLATAVHCINLGASSVIITSRDAAKGEAAKASIAAQTQGRSVVEVMYLDMSTFAGVREFAEKVKEKVRCIDTVFLNAGVQNVSGSVSKEGWENTLQVNVLSTALLALLLLPWMKTAGKGKAHLAFTGSGMHRGVDVGPKSGWPQHDVLKYWNTKENFKKAGGTTMYSNSKLLLMYTMREIAKLAMGSDGR